MRHTIHCDIGLVDGWRVNEIVQPETGSAIAGVGFIRRLDYGRMETARGRLDIGKLWFIDPLPFAVPESVRRGLAELASLKHFPVR